MPFDPHLHEHRLLSNDSNVWFLGQRRRTLARYAIRRRFSTSRPESCPIHNTPEFPTTPSRGQEKRPEDGCTIDAVHLLARPSYTLTLPVRCSGSTPARTHFSPGCLFHELARALRPGGGGAVRRTRGRSARVCRGAPEFFSMSPFSHGCCVSSP